MGFDEAYKKYLAELGRFYDDHIAEISKEFCLETNQYWTKLKINFQDDEYNYVDISEDDFTFLYAQLPGRYGTEDRQKNVDLSFARALIWLIENETNPLKVSAASFRLRHIQNKEMKVELTLNAAGKTLSQIKGKSPIKTRFSVAIAEAIKKSDLDEYGNRKELANKILDPVFFLEIQSSIHPSEQLDVVNDDCGENWIVVKIPGPGGEKEKYVLETVKTMISRIKKNIGSF